MGKKYRTSTALPSGIARLWGRSLTLKAHGIDEENDEVGALGGGEQRGEGEEQEQELFQCGGQRDTACRYACLLSAVWASLPSGGASLQDHGSQCQAVAA